MANTQIARLKISLDRVEPVVMRRVVVPLSIRFDRQHTLVQVAMGWSGSHLWAMLARDIEWGPRDPDGNLRDGPLDASKARLGDVLADVDTMTLKYVYDFGDGWQHTIKVERLFAGVPVPRELPFLLEATGRCPPEDVGGPSGYMELLAAIADPQHPRHAEAEDLLGADYRPAANDSRAIEKAVGELASKWTAKSRKPEGTAKLPGA